MSSALPQLCPAREAPPAPHQQPIEIALSILGGRWKAAILAKLLSRVHRFSELRRNLPGVSAKMLTESLRQLEREGVVSRTVYPTVPPCVEYQLTPEGQALGPVLRAVAEWGALLEAGRDQRRTAHGRRHAA